VADDHPTTPPKEDEYGKVSTETKKPAKVADGDIDEAYENVEPAE
jgi:hypothetical protein